MSFLRFLLIAIVFLMPGGLAAARNKSVEVNLDVLDELKNYQPPPMFDAEKPATPAAEKPENKNKPKAAETQAAPVPRKKPKIAAQEKEKPSKISIREASPLPKAALTDVEATPLDGTEDTDEPPVLEPEDLAADAQEQEEAAPPDAPERAHDEASLPPQPAPFLMDAPQSAELIQSRPGTVSLNFSSGKTDVPPEMQDILQVSILDAARVMPDARIEIRSYAAAPPEGESQARRLSLLRALQIRDYLVTARMDSGRIDILPLGTQTRALPADRVDIVVKPVF